MCRKIEELQLEIQNKELKDPETVCRAEELDGSCVSLKATIEPIHSLRQKFKLFLTL